MAADASRAHNKVTALKIPRGAPRFRSFVQGDTSALDIRDPSETEENTVTKHEFVRQVGPFELGHADLTADLTGQLNTIVGELRALQQPGKLGRQPARRARRGAAQSRDGPRPRGLLGGPLQRGDRRPRDRHRVDAAAD